MLKTSMVISDYSGLKYCNISLNIVKFNGILLIVEAKFMFNYLKKLNIISFQLRGDGLVSCDSQ